ncbi:MAG: aspartate-semialdehyde dehydrogenase, partial [Methanobacteriota archaeon]
LLADHPDFGVVDLVGDRSAGKTYRDAVRWVLEGPIPRGVADMKVKADGDDLEAGVCFSAVPSGTALGLEARLAKAGRKVFSNAKDHRMDPTVPLMVPEINADHAGLVKAQGGDGFIVTNPNCTTIVLVMSLAPLARAFGLRKVHCTSMQAISGAGYPGVPSLDILGNVVPFIGGEEEKVETEPLKIMGRLDGARVRPAEFTVSATCTRVPVQEAHSISVAVELDGDPTREEVLEAWRQFRGEPQMKGLPLAPKRPLHVHDADDRPQPRRDWALERGMAVSVGRLRADRHFTYKYFVSGSNTVRGAAGCSILNAELFHSRGLL